MKKTIEELQKSDREFLTAREIAEFMGVSRKTVYKYIKNFNIRVERIGNRVLIPKRAFIEFILRTR